MSGQNDPVGPASDTQVLQAAWLPIDSAPRDGTRIRGRGPVTSRYLMPGSVLWGRRTRIGERVTRWGKTSHVPLYGWNYGRDPEDQNLWHPTHWKPL